MAFRYLLIFCLILIPGSLLASQKLADEIANISSNSLGYMDRESLKEIIDAYIQDKPHIIGLRITEALTEEPYINMYRRGGEVRHSLDWPPSIEKHPHFKSESIFNEDLVGQILLYVDPYIAQKIQLTEEEKAFLDSMNTFRVNLFDHEAPLTLIENGEAKGYINELLALAFSKFGKEITWIPMEYGEAIESIKTGELDILTTAKEDMGPDMVLKTRDYYSTLFAAVSRIDTPDIENLDQIGDKTVASVGGFLQTLKIQENFPNIQLLLVENVSQGIEAIRLRKADYFIGNASHAGYFLRETFAADLKIAGSIPKEQLGSLRFAYGVVPDKPLLRSILDKALDALTVEELKAIKLRWLPGEAQPIWLQLTKDEEKFLQTHTEITLGTDRDWKPYVVADDKGALTGIEPELIKRINAMTGANIRLVTGEWSELVEKAKRHEIDGLAVSARHEERAAHFLFSDSPYTVSKYIYSHDLKISSMDDLVGRRVGFRKGNQLEAKLLGRIEGIVPVAAESNEALLSMLQSGQVDAAIAGITLRLSALEKMIGDIDIVFIVPDSDTDMVYSIRKDWPELHSIVNKALAAIPLRERLTILNKWRGDDPSTIVGQLTDEERAWLAAHPVIRVHNEKDWPPWNFNRDNQPMGYSIDYMNLIAQRLGIRVEYITGPEWNEFLNMIRNKDLDVMLNLSYTEEREKYIHYTDGYLTALNGIYTRESEPALTSLDQVAREGKSLAVPEGFFNHQVLEKHYPEIRLVLVKDQMATITAVLAGQADAALGREGVMNYLITDRLVAGLKLTGIVDDERFKGTASIGVRKDWPILRDIIRKAMRSIPHNELMELQRKWAVGGDSDRKIRLTEGERAWLKRHPAIRVVLDPDWAPVEFRDEEGNYQGMSADYIKRLEELLKVKLDIVHEVSWSKGLAKLKEKQVDMVSSIARTEEREKFALFTDDYISMPVNIFARNDVSYIGNLRNLDGKRVAVVEGYAVSEWLTRDHPDIRQVPALSTSEALKMVSAGTVDAFVGNVVTTSYYLGKQGMSDVRVAGETPYSYDQSMAVRNDWQIFAGILQKALNAIDQPERDAFYNRWMSIKYEHRVDYTLLWQVLAVVTIILMLFFYWNRRLSIEVTQRKEAERIAELARDKAEVANLAKSTFLANMSHELRTPLNAILGFSEMLVRDKGANPEQQEKLFIIARSGEHLLSMINDVLDLSKIEAGRMELKPEAIDLSRMLEDIGRMFEVRAENAQLRFDMEIDPKLHRYIKVDSGKLREILINLLGNAVKFTQEGGFTLRARTQPLSDDPTMVALQLEVEDSGPGIGPEQLKRIFEPFVQATGSPSATKGTGLGLAITQSFVALMGGEIEVESEIDTGSLFRVELPVALAEEVEASRIEAVKPTVLGLEPGQAEWRILVVEDDAENRLLLRGLLTQVGFEIQEAENGEQAVALFKQWHPHFIWMDMRMPVMDGYEATAKIRELPDGDSVKIVAITASAFKDQRKAILEAGCDDVVHKPYQAHEIFDVMAQQLGANYIYGEGEQKLAAETAIELTREQLLQLPSGLQQSLANAVSRLDVDETIEVAEQVREIDARAADALIALAEGFQFGRIEVLLAKDNRDE